MEEAEKLWNETLPNFNPRKDMIVIYASISDLWKNKLTKSLIKDIKKHGKSLGYKVDVEMSTFNWLVIKK